MARHCQRVLYVCHGHPSVRPGGAEGYALELYEAMRASSSKFEPLLLVHSAALPQVTSTFNQRVRLAPVPDGDEGQTFFISETANYDPFTGRCRDGRGSHELFEDLLNDLRPDVVHFQHTLYLGYDLIGITRRTLPHVPIVYTLHEFLPICHHDGQMLRTGDRQPCLRPTPGDCSRCFPGLSADSFFLRQRYIHSQFSMVDRFIAPSYFLRERYLEWGLHPARVLVEEYGRTCAPRAAHPKLDGPRRMFGYFGQLTPFKGADVLLEAMRLLRECASPARLRIHGANLERQRPSFQQKLGSLLATAGENVAVQGKYTREELPGLMREVDWVVVPSIWWENSPLVIQEAFHHGRPVICSDIGGMAEKVRANVNGLHFRAADPQSLAATITDAIETTGLWDRLRQGIQPVYSMSEHLMRLEAVYEELLRDAAASASVPEGCVV